MATIWILALDVGQRKTGVAVGQSLTQTAKPLAVLRHPAQHLEAAHFAAWVREWSVSHIVIGLPKLRDGKEHPLAAPIRRIGAKCQEAFGLPGEKEVDARAAAIIAEDWLAGNGGAG